MTKGRVRTASLVLLVIALTAAAGFGAYTGIRRLHRDAGAHGLGALPSIFAAATAVPPTAPASASAPVPVAATVARMLGAKLSASALGSHVLAEVDDATGGTGLYTHLAATTAAPASTAKLLTAAALLAVRAPTDRITTRVVAGAAPGTVILVGGGDPTLSATDGSGPTPYPDAARIGDLAAQLRKANVVVSRIVVDGSLFSGPSRSPAWAAEDIPSDYAAPITAAMVDGARAAPTDVLRSVTPDLDAGRALAAALGRPGAAIALGIAAPGARQLAAVQSAPFSDLIEQMLQQSDNVIAECLARQVALATHATASFTGSAAAIRTVLAGLGTDPGAGMVDGSGLAAGDRVSTASLVGVLRLIASGPRPALRDIVTALPVAGWSGTLADRYTTAASGGLAAGAVRAKTGTLTGVSALAGLVRDADGRLLVFAFIADRVPAGTAATTAAETALDAAAAALAACGCR